MKICNNSDLKFSVILSFFDESKQTTIEQIKVLLPQQRTTSEELFRDYSTIPRYFKMIVEQEGRVIETRLEIENNTYVGLLHSRKRSWVHVSFEEDLSIEAQLPTSHMIKTAFKLIRECITSEMKDCSKSPERIQSVFHHYYLEGHCLNQQNLMRPEQWENAINAYFDIPYVITHFKQHIPSTFQK